MASGEQKTNIGEDKEAEVFAYAMQLSLGSVLPMTLQSAIEVGVFEIIAKAGPGAKLSASNIASELTTRNPSAPLMLDRILMLLASHNVLECSLSGSDKVYALAPVAKYFVKNEDGVCLGPFMALTNDKVFLESWPELKNAMVEGGISFNRVHGTHAFEYMGLDPRFNQVFNAAMYNQTTIVIKQILEKYKGFENLNKVVDVGGGLGHTIKAITSRYPHIKGINFDLPHVIEQASAYPGVKHIGGDMFESVPKGDAIFMKWILHDWSDEHCLNLLKNCYKSIPDNGKVIVVELLVPTLANSSSALGRSIFHLDVLMMTQNPGGKERTLEEFMALATTAGFRGITNECFACNFWVMEFFK